MAEVYVNLVNQDTLGALDRVEALPLHSLPRWPATPRMSSPARERSGSHMRPKYARKSADVAGQIAQKDPAVANTVVAVNFREGRKVA